MRRGSLTVRSISDLRNDLAQLSFGDHACPVYQSDKEQLDVAVAFIQLGLQRGEQCVFAGPRPLLSRLRAALRAAGVDVEHQIERGAMQLLADDEAYLRNGKFAPREMLDLVADIEKRALAEGFAGLRAIGEMSWALSGCSEQDLLAYEVGLNTFVKSHRMVALCQYDRREFHPAFIHDIIRMHRLVVVGREVFANPYHEPAERMLVNGAPSDEELEQSRIEWWVNALRGARETEQRAREMAARMAVLAEIAGGVVVTESMEQLRLILVEACQRVISFDALVIGLYDATDHTFDFIGAWDQGVYSTPAKVPAADTPGERVLKTRRTLITHRASDPEAQGAWLTGTGRRSESVMRSPLISGDQVIGILTVQSYTPDLYSEEDARVLEAVAALATAAIERIWRVEEQQAEADRRRLVEEQLRQAQKLEGIGRLAGGVAHDFNNLLVAIGGYAQLALDEMGDHSARSDIEEVLQNVERATALTRQLLIFSRKQTHHPREVELRETVHNIEKLLRRLIGADVDLHVSSGDGCKVYADPGQLEQVIVNLAINARDAMPQGGAITISNDCLVCNDDEVVHPDVPPGLYARLTVTDTGQGMDERTKEHIFEPFFTTKVAGHGTGLGLSLVYGIIKQSGGFIDVHSEVGKGTRFDILLPCMNE